MPRKKKGPRQLPEPLLFLPWRARDSNPRRQCQLIYSQPPLAARVARQDGALRTRHLTTLPKTLKILEFRVAPPVSAPESSSQGIRVIPR